MIRVLVLMVCISSLSFAQVRVSKLVVKPHEVYTLENSDILVADTLVMMDSSCIRLNLLKSENYIRAQVAIIGRNCLLNGRGLNGKKGPDGNSGETPMGPCKNGASGRNGSRGLDGTKGVNLFLYIDSLKINGSLAIDLSGGNGGDGGNGGMGGGGSPGTKHCFGGNGANGSNGGAGGNGGVGGQLTLGGGLQRIRDMIGEELKLYFKGGTFGYGGVSGAGGAAGLGPQGKNGKSGIPGVDGPHGRPGNIGTILFEDQQ